MTAEMCRTQGVSEETIASMEQNGLFCATDPIEDRRGDLQSEIDDVESDVESDLESWESDLAELVEAISKAKVKPARLRQQIAELPPPDEDD